MGSEIGTTEGFETDTIGGKVDNTTIKVIKAPIKPSDSIPEYERYMTKRQREEVSQAHRNRRQLAIEYRKEEKEFQQLLDLVHPKLNLEERRKFTAMELGKTGRGMNLGIADYLRKWETKNREYRKNGIPKSLIKKVQSLNEDEQDYYDFFESMVYE